MSLIKFLDTASSAYYAGNPIISDSQFDYLAEAVGYSKVGARPEYKVAKHMYRMYSLQKYYPGEGRPPLQDYNGQKVVTPKLDGAAVSFLYVNGQLVEALTRGDGIEGQVITDKFIGNYKSVVPTELKTEDAKKLTLQIVGEIVAPKDIVNARNYASGALNLNSLEEFQERELYFVAYDVLGYEAEYYTQKLQFLQDNFFDTVANSDFCDMFPQDGMVTRINSEKLFKECGYTSKHPRGAFATKSRSAGIKTILREVIWQTGKSGKVTPVAIFDPVVIDGANISRATLNNPGYIEALNLDIGDYVFVERAGGIIPSIVGSESFSEQELT